MRFQPIPAQHFATFHHEFRGDTPDIFSVCKKCGGACEFNKIGTLMPGEREYMAAAQGVMVEEFADRYLDVLVMDDGTELDVLRLTNGCPFLDRTTFECGCRDFKVVLCEIYPVVFHVDDERVEFSVDDWCPVSDTPCLHRHFGGNGVAAVSKLPVPSRWYELVALYDELYFDYVKLEAHRKSREELETFRFADLLTFQRSGNEHDPIERFRPDVVGLPTAL